MVKVGETTADIVAMMVVADLGPWLQLLVLRLVIRLAQMIILLMAIACVVGNCSLATTPDTNAVTVGEPCGAYQVRRHL